MSRSCCSNYKSLNFMKILKPSLRMIFMTIYTAILVISCGQYPTKFSAGVFILFLMTGFWVTACIPMYITALFPVVLGPVLGVVPSNEICSEYISDTVMLFVGGIIIAQCIEHTKLHQRISLNVLKRFGTDKRFMLIGFMIPTWFLSMWINNTATVAMMLPIVSSVLECLENVNAKKIENGTVSEEKENNVNGHRLNKKFYVVKKNISLEITSSLDNELKNCSFSELQLRQENRREIKRIGAAISLAICYSAACGGTTTLTGTAPTTIMMGILNSRYPHVNGLNFSSWMGFCLPISIFQLLISWFILLLFFIGPRCRNEEDEVLKRVLVKQAQKCGRISYQESVSAFLFALVGILWITRDIGHYGWHRFFKQTVLQDGTKEDYVKDAQVAMFVAILCMIIPSKNPLKCIREKLTRKNKSIHRNDRISLELNHGSVKQEMKHLASSKCLLPWDAVQRKFPWGVIFVLGGGFALSRISKDSGLSEYAGDLMSSMKDWPTVALILISVLLGSILTTVTSNAATTTVLLPIALDLAEISGYHPFLLSFPLVISTSFAFCLPVSTPPNAIVFSTGRVTVKEMASVGFIVNIFGVLVITICTYLYGIPMFQLDHVPSWVHSSLVNNTARNHKH